MCSHAWRQTSLRFWTAPTTPRWSRRSKHWLNHLRQSLVFQTTCRSITSSQRAHASVPATPSHHRRRIRHQLQETRLRALLDSVHRGGIQEVVVMHSDQLARFAIDLLEYIFHQKGVKLVVHRQDDNPGESTQQLAEVLMAITTVFVASHHGKRAAEGRRRRKRAREEEKENRAQQGQECVQPPPNQEATCLPQPHRARDTQAVVRGGEKSL